MLRNPLFVYIAIPEHLDNYGLWKYLSFSNQVAIRPLLPINLVAERNHLNDGRVKYIG